LGEATGDISSGVDLSQFCSGPLLCFYAAFRSKASGLFQPNAEWRRVGL
jgi:hypothetical protein